MVPTSADNSSRLHSKRAQPPGARSSRTSPPTASPAARRDLPGGRPHGPHRNPHRNPPQTPHEDAATPPDPTAHRGHAQRQHSQKRAQKKKNPGRSQNEDIPLCPGWRRPPRLCHPIPSRAALRRGAAHPLPDPFFCPSQLLSSRSCSSPPKENPFVFAVSEQTWDN